MLRDHLRMVAGIACLLMLLAGVASWHACDNPDPATTSGGSPATTEDVVSAALAFPLDEFTWQTKAVDTSAGTVQVTYRLYRHLTYVAEPVDEDYQSLDIAVPAQIDGVEIDTSEAPILFNIPVGGYMSAANTAGSGSIGGALGAPSGGSPGGKGASVSNPDLALAAGYVVVTPGCRGRDNVAADGTYYGKAPAAVVDLKCAVKYLHLNDSLIPGDSDRIVAAGTSAGGALSALLGASGDSDLYQPYFDELGAADASDAIYASACYCPITDLDHADMAYEWEFGATALGAGPVDQTLSAVLAGDFAVYLESLGLTGRSGFGTIAADNYAQYIAQTYLFPAAAEYLGALSDTERQGYLASHTWIEWDGSSASFTWQDYQTYKGRMKGLPAFDSFDLSSPECILFGSATTDARHYTDFSLRQTGDDQAATIHPDLKAIVDLMNPMHFIEQKNNGCAGYWWIRHGTLDRDTSLAVIVDLTTGLENLGKEVNTNLYWDAGHGANQDPDDFVAWIAAITGYSR